jgi:hypothetical protein
MLKKGMKILLDCPFNIWLTARYFRIPPRSNKFASYPSKIWLRAGSFDLFRLKIFGGQICPFLQEDLVEKKV